MKCGMAWVLFVHGYNEQCYIQYWIQAGFFCWTIKPPRFVQYNTHIFKPHAYFLLQFTGLHHEYFLYFVFFFLSFASSLRTSFCHTYEVNLIQKSGYKSWFSYFCYTQGYVVNWNWAILIFHRLCLKEDFRKHY